MMPPQDPRPTNVIDVIWQLDSWNRPGLTLAELRRLLTICNVCGLVMTKRAFERHQCLHLEDPSSSDDEMDAASTELDEDAEADEEEGLLASTGRRFGATWQDITGSSRRDRSAGQSSSDR